MIFKDNFKQLYTIDLRSTVSKYICPACSQTRRNKKDRSLYINRQTMVGKCFNCDRVFFEHKEIDNIVKDYKLPKIQESTLDEKILQYFQDERKISNATINYLKITSGQAWMPQKEKEVNCIKFNFYKSDKLINVKYRDAEKNFRLEKDCEITFYNYNAILEHKAIIITEGEIDCASWIETGMYNVVSLPNGCKSLDFINECIFDIERVEKWFLSVDKDQGGIEARAELVSKLGIEKCYLINTHDCKDANSYLIKYGSKKLRELYDTAEKIIEEEEKFDLKSVVDESIIWTTTEVPQRELIWGQMTGIGGEIIEILTKGNISMINGKAKSRKSFTSMFIISQILNPEHGYVGSAKNGIVLFDTEQFRDHSVRFIRRLNRLCNLEVFRMFNLRSYNKETRFKAICEYIEQAHPSVAIIDNVRDIIRNFNDIEQSDDIVTALSNLSESTGTHIICTLHVNKADNNARGHIGAELSNKAETVFLVETDPATDITKLTPYYTRNMKFKEINFIIADGLPRITEDEFSVSKDNQTYPF